MPFIPVCVLGMYVCGAVRCCEVLLDHMGSTATNA